ncbi:hypothetical protein AB0K08_11400 [Citricoccus sp. NPDC055426]|uniref:hypothetical protein n=1 Tax=Citricoccus sp. NPDC055426 TaxID=3155536 RepID=UPI003433E971
MRFKTMLQTTAVLGLAVVAGLLGVTGTWALWSTSASAGAGTVQAADFQLELDGKAASSGTIALTPPGGQLMPDQPIYSSFSVTNSTNASGDFRVQVTLGTPVVRPVGGNAALADHLVVETTAAPASESCGTADYGNKPATAAVDKNRSARFCVRFTLPADAPPELSDASATADIPVTATQIPPTSQQ